MTVLVTGAAGFIGYNTAMALLARGEQVIGYDVVNDYYDVTLKETRLARLAAHEGFEMVRADVADREAAAALVKQHPDIDRVVHLAAQAGVRHSLIDPYAYTRSNVEGHLVMLEACRTLPVLRHFVYASSSSVYGGNREMPFSVDQRVDQPLSLYAVTKRAGELMAQSFAYVHRLPQTGLRFFTVYGPWGRPDMAAYIFADKIYAGEPIDVFNDGKMSRDFTYIDDIVAGILGCLDRPPVDDGETPPHRVYNLGNHKAEPLMRFISLLEDALGRKAEINFKPMQTGDVAETFADIDASRRDFGFDPRTGIEEGIPRFVAWYREYHGITD